MVVGLDVGGTKTNATLLDSKGVFLNNRMLETPSRVLEGPEAAIEAMAKVIELAIGGAGAFNGMPTSGVLCHPGDG